MELSHDRHLTALEGVARFGAGVSLVGAVDAGRWWSAGVDEAYSGPSPYPGRSAVADQSERQRQASKRLLKTLLASQRITQPQFQRVQHELRRSKLPLERVLLDMGLVTWKDLLLIRSMEIGVPYIDLTGLTPAPEVVMLLPESFARKHAVIALEKEGGTLLVAAADPTDIQMTDAVRGLTRCRVELRLGSEGEIRRKLMEYHDHYQAVVVEKLLGSSEDQGVELAQKIGLSLSDIDEVAAETRASIRNLNLLLLHALLKQASDVHLEPGSQNTAIKYRIDGVLHLTQRMQTGAAQGLVNRIKVMAGLDIAERRLPQDGSFYLHIEGREIAVRVATTPTLLGEKVVLRILDKDSLLLGLEHLGFNQADHLRFRGLIHRPNGIILVVGPTGSGKTTTLYNALLTLNTGTRNITTIEDPVEYQIDGITQIQVNEDIELSTARILRSVLRQDPDVILVGEIRDRETMRAAIRASLTGHTVFATLHTNDAASAVTRLIDMGVEPFLVSSSVNAILAQRLVRRVCPACREPYTPGDALLKRLELSADELAGASLYRARGCPECLGTGYRGRVGIFELMVMDESLRDLILETSDAGRIRNQALAGQSLRTLRRDGLDKALAGETTLEEVLRVT